MSLKTTTIRWIMTRNCTNTHSFLKSPSLKLLPKSTILKCSRICFSTMISRLWSNRASDLIISPFPITILKEKTKEYTFIKIAKRFVNCLSLAITGSKPKISYSMFLSPLKSFMTNPNPRKSNKTKPISSRLNLKLIWFTKRENLSKANKSNANPVKIQNASLNNTN
jgi:hypothetical protein